MKKILAATVAVSAMAFTGAANAAITGPATPTKFVSGASAPAASAAFTLPNVVVTQTGDGYTSAFVTGNTLILTLQGGVTFNALPTVALTGSAGTVTYISGGPGSSQVTYQLGGVIDATTVVTYSNITVNNVTAVTNSSKITALVTDGSGTLAAGTTTALRTATLADFTDPYTVTFAPSVTPTGAFVDLGATAPGSRYTVSSTASTPGNANLGIVTITPAAAALVNWAAVPSALTAVGSTGSSLSLTIPGTPFVSANVISAGSCIAYTPAAVTTATANVVTFPMTGFVIAAPTGAACTLQFTLTNPTTGTALLAAGPTSAALTIGLGGVSSTTVTGTTRSFNPALTPVTYSGGSVINAAYSVGEDANYNYFINVSNAGTAGPVIVTASVGGATGTAVLASTLAANTSAIFSIAEIRAKLIEAGMSDATFADANSRGNLQVVVPTGARITPLLQNKVNGQVVDISRQP